eukprot:scaffold150380_cov28-Tisochrysis_lutea.AAC.2
MGEHALGGSEGSEAMSGGSPTPLAVSRASLATPAPPVRPPPAARTAAPTTPRALGVSASAGSRTMSENARGPRPRRLVADDWWIAWNCRGSLNLFTRMKRGRTAMMDVLGTASCACSCVCTPSTPADPPSHASP